MMKSEIRVGSRLGRLLAVAAGVVAIASTVSGQAQHSQRAPDREAPVKVEPGRLDMGGCVPGDPVTGQAMITNTSDRPLTVLRTQSSCKCTVPKIQEKMILPGESISVEATVDVGYDLGMFAKRVSVFFDGYSRPAMFNVVGEVHYAVKTTPTSLKARGTTEKVRFRVEGTDGETFEVLRVGGETPQFVGFDPLKDPPQMQYTIEYVVPLDPPAFICVETDHPGAPVVEIDFTHPTVSDAERDYRTSPLRVEERRWNVGEISYGESATFELEVKGPFVLDEGTPLDGLELEVFIPEDFPATLESFTLAPGSENGKIVVKASIKPTEMGLVLVPLHYKYAGMETRVWVIGSCREPVLGQR